MIVISNSVSVPQPFTLLLSPMKEYKEKHILHRNQKNFFLERNTAAMILATMERIIMIKNPHGVLENGIPAALTFIP